MDSSGLGKFLVISKRGMDVKGEIRGSSDRGRHWVI